MASYDPLGLIAPSDPTRKLAWEVCQELEIVLKSVFYRSLLGDVSEEGLTVGWVWGRSGFHGSLWQIPEVSERSST